MVARAAFGVEKAEEIFEGVRVGAIPQVGSLAANDDEVFVFQFVEVMREGGIWDVDLGLDIADDHALGLSGHEELHDAEARFGAHGGEHIREAGNLSGRHIGHVSIILEIWNNSQALFCGTCLPVRATD